MLLVNSLLTILVCSTEFTDAKNVTAVRGSPVHLPCPASLDSDETVVFQWKKCGTPGVFCSYQVTKYNITVKFCDFSQFNIREPHKLYITNPKKSNSGRYNCSIEKIIPPPTTESIYTVDLHVEEPPALVLERQNSSAPSCTQLLCTLEGLRPREVNFTWSRQGQGSTEPLSAIQSSLLSSSLILCQSECREGDIITCNVSHSANYTGFTEKFKLSCSHAEGNSGSSVSIVSIIIVIAILSSGIVISALCVCFYKCYRRFIRSDAVSYNNQIYENFDFIRQIRQTTLPGTKPECIYEN